MSTTVAGRWARGEIDLAPKDNPAKYSHEVLVEVDHLLTAEAERVGRRLDIFDPYGGTGRLHRMGDAAHRIVTFELEVEWGMQAEGPNVLGDSRFLAARDNVFDVAVSSPCYGSRMGDCHENKDECRHLVKRKGQADRQYALADCPKCKGTGLTPRNTYRHKLGRMPTAGSLAVEQWGPRFRRLNQAVMVECLRVLRPGGLVVWNTSNHYRTLVTGGPQVEQRVNEWFLNEWMALGCNVVEVRAARTRRNRFGQNGDARAETELVAALRAPEKREGTTQGRLAI